MEKTTSYTAGPWDRQNKGNVTSPSARHEVVAGINKDGSKCLPTICRMPGLSDEDYANARLIAAAPDLLDALKRVERYLQGNRTGAHFEESDIVGIVQTAIAKAEGQE